MKLVGEIGISRQEYLYDLQYVDILQIERGYERRHRHLWSAVRWETFYMLCAQAGGDKLSEKGINSPADLLPFPWDTDELPLTDEETVALQNEILEYNLNNSNPKPQEQ